VVVLGIFGSLQMVRMASPKQRRSQILDINGSLKLVGLPMAFFFILELWQAD